MKLLAGLLASALISTPLQVEVSDRDYSHFLERSAQAEFSGERLISCSTPDGVRDAVLEVSQSDEEMVISSPVGGGGAVRTGQGQVAVVDPSGNLRVTEVTSDSWAPTSSYYRTRPPERSWFLGREVEEIIVERQGIARARMIFDLDTGALLRSLVLEKDKVYCDARMISFASDRNNAEILGITPPAPTSSEQVRKLESTDDFDRSIFPDELHGFRRIDQYHYNRDGGGGKQVLAFYSDGFFSFTLLHSRNQLVVEDSNSLVSYKLNGGNYQRQYGTGTALHVWETRRGGLATYGDLPPDLWELVISDLTPPGKPSVFTRWWRQLFG